MRVKHDTLLNKVLCSHTKYIYSYIKIQCMFLSTVWGSGRTLYLEVIWKIERQDEAWTWSLQSHDHRRANIFHSRQQVSTELKPLVAATKIKIALESWIVKCLHLFADANQQHAKTYKLNFSLPKLNNKHIHNNNLPCVLLRKNVRNKIGERNWVIIFSGKLWGLTVWIGWREVVIMHHKCVCSC